MKRVEITINYKSKNIEENEEFTNTDVYAYASRLSNKFGQSLFIVSTGKKIS